jgi:hypothetical protein
MGHLEAVRRYAYGALGYLNRENDGQGSPSVDVKVSDERCLEEYAHCRALIYHSDMKYHMKML